MQITPNTYAPEKRDPRAISVYVKAYPALSYFFKTTAVACSDVLMTFSLKAVKDAGCMMMMAEYLCRPSRWVRTNWLYHRNWQRCPSLLEHQALLPFPVTSVLFPSSNELQRSTTMGKIAADAWQAILRPWQRNSRPRPFPQRECVCLASAALASHWQLALHCMCWRLATSAVLRSCGCALCANCGLLTGSRRRHCLAWAVRQRQGEASTEGNILSFSVCLELVGWTLRDACNQTLSLCWVKGFLI